MKVALVGSMAFAREMLEVKSQLEKTGHSAYVSDFIDDFVGKTEAEKEQ